MASEPDKQNQYHMVVKRAQKRQVVSIVLMQLSSQVWTVHKNKSSLLQHNKQHDKVILDRFKHGQIASEL